MISHVTTIIIILQCCHENDECFCVVYDFAVPVCWCNLWALNVKKEWKELQHVCAGLHMESLISQRLHPLMGHRGENWFIPCSTAIKTLADNGHKAGRDKSGSSICTRFSVGLTAWKHEIIWFDHTHFMTLHRFTGVEDPNHFIYDYNPCAPFTTPGGCTNPSHVSVWSYSYIGAMTSWLLWEAN